MGSVLSAEEFYSDAYDFLKDIRDMVEDIRDNIGYGDQSDQITDSNKAISKNNSSRESKKEDSGIGIDIKSVVESINSIDKDKSSLLIQISDKFSAIKPPSGSMNNINSLAGGINEFAQTISGIEIDEGNLENVVKLASSVSAINSMARSIVFNAPFLLLATPISRVFPILLSNIANGIASLDGKLDSMERFPVAMRNIGIGLTIFSLGLTASVALIGYTVLRNPEALLALGAVIGAVSITAYIIGQKSGIINKGAFTIGIMALALPIFALGVSASAKLMEGVGYEGLLLLGGVLGVTALSFGIIGKFAGTILMGALAVGAMGLALWLFAMPLKTISEVVADKDTLWTIPTLITAIGTVFGVAGVASGFILAGALAIGATGVALIALGFGLDKIMSIPNFTEQKAQDFAGSLNALVGVFNEMSLKDLITLPLKLPILAGMGLALIPIGFGIESFLARTKNFTDADADRMTYVISKVSESFATAGSTEGMSKLFGFNVGSNDVERGIESTMKMGKNLDLLSKGIASWRDAKFTKEDIEKVGQNVSNVMNTIPAVFADIGQRERGSGNQIKIGDFQFGVPFTKGDTELGIASTMEMGQNLKNLYDGVVAWKKGGKNDISPQLPGIVSNIVSVLTAIPQAFVKVGEMEAESEKMWGLIDGNMEEGVELVSEMTEPLVALSGILTSFSKGINSGKVSKSVKEIMSGIVSSVDLFTNKRIDSMEMMIEQFEDFNDVLEDHFDIMKKMPKLEIEAFGKHSQAINSLHTMDSSKIDTKLNTGTQYVVKPKPQDVSKIKSDTVSSENKAKAKPKTDAKPKVNKEGDNAEVVRLLSQLVSIASDKRATMEILNILRSGTIKVEDDSL